VRRSNSSSVTTSPPEVTQQPTAEANASPLRGGALRGGDVPTSEIVQVRFVLGHALPDGDVAILLRPRLPEETQGMLRAAM